MFLTLVSSTEEGHICRPPPGGESWLGLFIIIFWGCFSEGSQVGCSRAARWDIRGTEELGGRGKLRLAKEAKEKRKERGSKQRRKEGLPAKKEE